MFSWIFKSLHESFCVLMLSVCEAVAKADSAFE